MSENLRFGLLVPHYNHATQFIQFLPKLLAAGLPIIIVDDGSSESSLSELKSAVSGQGCIYVVTHKTNRGKGAAVKTGMMYAGIINLTHIIQIDADGQHNVEDIQNFMEASKKSPDAFICGKPVFDNSVPKVRLYGRKVTNFWVMLETLSFKVKDGLCGFRIYPVSQFERIVAGFYLGNRMDFDTEVLVKAVWLDVALNFLETKVRYLEESVSHFHYKRDNLILIKLHTRLMFQSVLWLPARIWRVIKGPNS